MSDSAGLGDATRASDPTAAGEAAGAGDTVGAGDTRRTGDGGRASDGAGSGKAGNAGGSAGPGGMACVRVRLGSEDGGVLGGEGARDGSGAGDGSGADDTAAPSGDTARAPWVCSDEVDRGVASGDVMNRKDDGPPASSACSSRSYNSKKRTIFKVSKFSIRASRHSSGMYLFGAARIASMSKGLLVPYSSAAERMSPIQTAPYRAHMLTPQLLKIHLKNALVD